MSDPSISAQDAAAEKALCYGILEAYLSLAKLPNADHDDISEANQCKADYLRMEVPGNANPYVAWANRDLEF